MRAMAAVTVVSGWGGVSRPARLVRFEDPAEIPADAELARGLGRAYGDAALPATPGATLLSTLSAARVLAFDDSTGRMRAQAGVSLERLHRDFLPRGWFVPVSPGTQYVTLGGMVAADVHGKNHHVAGCFGEHVTRLLLQTPDGSLRACGPEDDGDLFRATIGGMGLTGHILEVEFHMERVERPWIVQESVTAGDLDELLEQLEQAGRSWPFTVAWADCLARGGRFGRGLVLCGRWARAGEAPARPPAPRRRLRVPMRAPSGLLSASTGRLFNAATYHLRRRASGTALVAPGRFFYPLDAVRDWNRLYGRRGFTQYQCVIPRAAGRAGVRHFLERFRHWGGVSLLTVIKDCGREGRGLLSFPRPGTSIALDLPLTAATETLVFRLNELLIDLGGRVYLAKDLLTRADQFQRMEPRLPAFCRLKRAIDPDGRIRSALSARLRLCDASEQGG